MSMSLICWEIFDRNGRKITVPAPPDTPYVWDFFAGQAHTLAAKGFSRLQLLPASKAQGGASPGSDGYGIFNPRDLGTKPQQGSTPTRYGTANFAASPGRRSPRVDLDIVLHQLMGGNDATYRYLGADGKFLNDRSPSPTRATATF